MGRGTGGPQQQRGCGGSPEISVEGSSPAQGELEMTNLDMKPGTSLKLKGRILDDADG